MTLKRNVETLRDPQWSSAEHKGILCKVKFKEYAEELPFHALPDDIEDHGRDIHARLLAGEAGPIAPYVAR